MMQWEGVRRVTYDCGEHGIAVFVPVCPKCGRLVKAGESIFVTLLGRVKSASATCSKCGEIEMPFEGWFHREELQ